MSISKYTHGGSDTRMVAVDAVRGLAALVVLFHHVLVYYPNAISDAVQHSAFWLAVFKIISDQNTGAVMLFFIVSGFCIATATRDADFFSKRDCAAYALRRASRILPLYWLALIFTAAVGFGLGEGQSERYSGYNLIGNLLFLQSADTLKGAWFVPYGGNGPFWSLSYEAFYYVMFPAVAMLEARILKNSIYKELAALAGAYLVSAIALIAYRYAPTPPLSFLSLYCVWRTGMCLQRTSHGGAWPLLALTVTVALVLSTPPFRASATASLVLKGTLLAIAWLVVQRLIWHAKEAGGLEAKPKSFNAQWGPLRVLATVGSISYALYLFHYPILRAASISIGDTAPGLLVGLVGSFAVAILGESIGRIPRDMAKAQFAPAPVHSV